MELTPILFVFALVFGCACCFDMKKQSSSGYASVREGCHMFYWLYPAADFVDNDFKPIDNPERKPLVLWLQGGPGASSTGYGNFELIGPLDTNLEIRNSSWLQHANLLFVDNPVGTGFSYVDNDKLYTTTNHMIGEDLTQLLMEFLNKYPAYQQTPFYVFSESYGGKMAVGFAQELVKAIDARRINCNFQGIVLGDSWISPIDSVIGWPEYLSALSLIDEQEKKRLVSQVEQIKQLVYSKEWYDATQKWSLIENSIDDYAANVDFYNVLKHHVPDLGVKHSNQFGVNASVHRLLSLTTGDKLSDLMNNEIKKILGIPKPIFWGQSSNAVFGHLLSDFMRPVVAELNNLVLSQKQLKVVIYNGQLDLIVPTLGTNAWIESLTGLEAFHQQNKVQVRSETTGKLLGFKRSYENLAYYVVLNAGHMIAIDAPEAGLKILKETIQAE